MLERERINRYLTPSLALPDAREVFVRQESGWTWRLLFPNGIDPFSILNDLIGGDQRATEVSGGCNYRSVSGIANSGQGNGFKKDFDCVGLDLKVCGRSSSAAQRRNGTASRITFFSTRRAASSKTAMGTMTECFPCSTSSKIRCARFPNRRFRSDAQNTKGWVSVT